MDGFANVGAGGAFFDTYLPGAPIPPFFAGSVPPFFAWNAFRGKPEVLLGELFEDAASSTAGFSLRVNVSMSALVCKENMRDIRGCVIKNDGKADAVLSTSCFPEG